jgi:hypothetical protein
LTVSVEVVRTGVRIRAATPEEVSAIAVARRGGKVVLGPGRSYTFDQLRSVVQEDELYVVSQAFVEFMAGGETERWVAMEHHGGSLPTDRDATLQVLDLARETLEDRIDLLSDLRIAGPGVTRWQLFSAPSVIELDPELESQLAPLRRG